MLHIATEEMTDSASSSHDLKTNSSLFLECIVSIESILLAI